MEPSDGAKRIDGEPLPAPSGDRTVNVSGGDTLPEVFRSYVGGVMHFGGEGEPFLKRVKAASRDHAPRLREASKNSARDLLAWTRRGSAIRGLLVISVGSITLIVLTGLLIFMFFLAVATVNAIIISIFMSLAAAGGFLAIFFACLTAVYIGALSVAVFVISATTISAIIAVMIVTGWVGFFWVVWLGAKKSLDLTKHSIDMTSSAIQAYSSARHTRHMSRKPTE